ncbi:hypothetical protein KJY73_04185 [Bowmanella sp. Y26]|uniref:hypothetical protein n=1 Tax=Bowmanella yangjiangensis TaxID=2811230 RepID=UPI001BDBC8ED|nr:hypothetical protein [Bowmanella yangjiangensis]MBT1062758.1 hypothetical protein [Bowmanella yangjiangensis]
MELVLIIFLLLMLSGILFLGVRLILWILKNKTRARVLYATLILGLIGLGVHNVFYKNMRFIQSEVYPNLYLVKYPDEDVDVLYQAIRQRVITHLKSEFPAGKTLAYEKETSIFFYQYYKAFPISVFQDEGTAYFLENEEDLGGMVTEELGMYGKYKLAEFNYTPCQAEAYGHCGELRYFDENGLVKSDRLSNLVTPVQTTKDASDTAASPGF